MKNKILVFISVAVACFISFPKASFAQGNQGLQSGAPINDNGSINFTDQTANLISQAGAGWVKINFRLGGCYQDWTTVGCNGINALQEYDQIINSALAKGLKVLGSLSNETWHGYSSDYQANNAEIAGGNGDNIYLQNFSKQAALVLAQYFAGKVSNWEIWNEPSQSATYLYPSNFAWLLAHVYNDTKQAGVSGISLVSGGITCLQDSRNNITSVSSGAGYLTNTYKQGKNLAGWDTIKTTYGSYPLDGVGQHIYIDGFTKTTSGKISSCLNYLRNAYVAYEGTTTTKKSTITEFGWATNNISEKNQAINLQTAYSTFKKTAYVQNAYWFFLQDIPVANLYFGLLRSDGSQKPSWSSYKAYANY